MTTATMTDPVDALLDRLEGVRQTGPHQWEARCPGHEDRHASLSVSRGEDGRALLFCHANCSPIQVVQALGLRLSALFPPKEKRKPRVDLTWRTPSEAAEELAAREGATPGGVWIYHDAGGAEAMGVVRLNSGGGKTFKPLHMADGCWRIGDPPGKLPLYQLPTLLSAGPQEPIYVVEGERCADVAAGLGLTATTSAHGAAQAGRTDWTPLAGRDVVILPDADAAGRGYAEAVGRILAALDPPASVRLLELPGLPEGGDIADWTDANDGQTADDLRAALLALAESAPAWKPSAVPHALPSPTIIEHPEPLRLAEHYLAHGQRSRLLRWRGDFYVYAGAAYERLPDESLDARLYNHIDTLWTPERRDGHETGKLKKIMAKAAAVREVRLGLPSRKGVLLDHGMDCPAWLDGRADPPAGELFTLVNGHLHLPTGHLLPLTSELFSVNSVQYPYTPDAPPPTAWQKFLDDLWGDDQESKTTLQELVGLWLTTDTRQQKIALVVGPKRSGKGTIARVLTNLLGPANVAGPTLAGLGTNFGLQPLIGKPLAIISDARLGGRVDQAAIVERLLSISGEDALTIDRKHVSAWTGRLPTRFMLLTNELPRLADTSGALASRFIVLVLTQSWLGNEDPTLTDRLCRELPGIFNWALEGWRRLTARGYFVQPRASADAIQELENLGSPVAAFLADRCRVEQGLAVAVVALYDAWQKWCAESGREHPGTVQSFSRDIKAAVPGATTRRLGGHNSSDRQRVIEGIDLR